MDILHGPRDGETFNSALDEVRLNRQASAVWSLMADGKWRSLSEISLLTGHPEASVSARLRDFRKSRFGRHEVQRKRDEFGFFNYRLVPNVDA